MDTSEYMPMFLAESREHLQELNLAVVHIEESPDDRATVDEIFRIAHSLKGMSATMGFARIAELTHQMEEVLELLRQRSGGLSREAIDTLLACLDALSAAVDTIEASGQETLDPAPLIERLRQLVRSQGPDRRAGDRREGDDRRQTPASEQPPAPAAPPELLEAAAALTDGAQLLHVKVSLQKQVLMPAARALMVVNALARLWRGASERSRRRIRSRASRVARSKPGSSRLTSRTASPKARVRSSTSRWSTWPRSMRERKPPASDDAPPPRRHSQSPSPRPTLLEPCASTPSGWISLMHSMGELVIHRTAVEALTAGLEVPGLQQAVQDLTRSSQALQSMVMQVRMIPVDIVFLRFPRLVRDLSTKLGKDVELELVGKETELDRTVVDALGDPLVHLVRNSLDHGLESPEARAAAGKPSTGKLQIAARHAGGSVVIEVRDDGHGIDPQVIARKALAAGLIDAETAADLDMRGAVELLFAPGFTTADTASDISGRGVGMDAVRTKIRELGGEVVIDSTLGSGTMAQIRLPLTLAIVSALQVDVAGAPFAIPLDRVERTLRLTPKMVSTVAGRRVLVLEDAVLPLLEGAKTFARDPSREHELVVIVRGQDRRLGLAVDELVGQRELVTRPLPNVVSDGEPVSGGAVLADGRIALIVDCDALAA